MMKALIVMLFCAPLMLLAQQNQTDSSRVIQNAEKIDELKQMIRASLEEVDEMALLKGELSLAKEKIAALEKALDSLSGLLKTYSPPPAPGEYLLVLESQHDLARGNTALKQMQRKVNANLKLVLSESGYWYYVVMSDGVSAEELEYRLFQAKKKVSDTWFIERSKTRDTDAAVLDQY